MTKILLVEDDKSLREIYGVRLLAEGYDIISAGDGEEALAMAIKERPALIVSDVMMPKISGFDMLDILRSTTETKTIKVIMMTALSSEDQRKRGEELGADRYLVKSQVGIEDVVRTVHDVLEDMLTTTQPTPATQFPQATPTALPTTAPAVSSPNIQQPQAAPMTAPVASRPEPSAYIPPARPEQTESPTVADRPEQQPVPQAIPVTSALDTTPQLPEPTAAAEPQVVPAQPPQSDLPQPTAPFSTPRPSNGSSDRVIEPIQKEDDHNPDAIADLIAKELGVTNPEQPQTPAPQQPAQSIPEPSAGQNMQQQPYTTPEAQQPAEQLPPQQPQQ